MSHWASQHFDTLESTIDGTNWTMDKPSSDGGPVIFNHSDGSEISIINSTISGGFAINYDPSNDEVDIFDNKHQSFADLDRMIEMAQHILNRHHKKN